MRILFLFLDGVGLGEADPALNPLFKARMPFLEMLLEGHKLVTETAPYRNGKASLLALDACLGIPGLPQSATGQATLLTGRNVPAELGYHYGPKPNPEIASIIRSGTIFSQLRSAGKKIDFLNAYPPGYFEGIDSGRRIFSAIPLAVKEAGLPLKTAEDLNRGQALAADFTGEAWREHLGLLDAPVLTAESAGERLAHLAQKFDFSFFEYWLSDYAGHRQDGEWAVAQLETFDRMLSGLIHTWDLDRDLIIVTSDHGNLEDLSTRRHTYNAVPGLFIGAEQQREIFSQEVSDLADIHGVILNLLGSS